MHSLVSIRKRDVGSRDKDRSSDRPGAESTQANHGREARDGVATGSAACMAWMHETLQSWLDG
jgi:hypothetical protein